MDVGYLTVRGNIVSQLSFRQSGCSNETPTAHTTLYALIVINLFLTHQLFIITMIKHNRNWNILTEIA